MPTSMRKRMGKCLLPTGVPMQDHGPGDRSTPPGRLGLCRPPTRLMPLNAPLPPLQPSWRLYPLIREDWSQLPAELRSFPLALPWRQRRDESGRLSRLRERRGRRLRAARPLVGRGAVGRASRGQGVKRGGGGGGCSPSPARGVLAAGQRITCTDAQLADLDANPRPFDAASAFALARKAARRRSGCSEDAAQDGMKGGTAEGVPSASPFFRGLRGPLASLPSATALLAATSRRQLVC